jgi:alkanesulfonate monooxygenase SsuD/methylene tetrahydromethanopterin reductase-like flavin-dependent oxidoreductase (luciferase family)
MADLEARGIPTVGVATTEFIDAAAAQAKSVGIDPAVVFVPHPVQDRTDDELKRLADDHLEAILALLVKGG